MQGHAFARRALLLALSSLPIAAAAAPSCADVQAFLKDRTIGELVCFHSDDLRTMTPETRAQPITPPNNAIDRFGDGTTLPGIAVSSPALTLPANFGSFTPVTDRTVISNGPTPTSGLVPGIQVEGWFADDPTHQARFVLRFPDDWNGKLVVAGASGTRSEYNGDYAWSDYVLPKGYAYASQNKGVLNFYVVNLGSATQPANDPRSCRVNPLPVPNGPPGGALSLLWVHFYDIDPQKPFTQWTQYMLATATLAQGAARATYHKLPSRTYAVGTSNGGYQVRLAIEAAPNLFDGGVDWEGTYVDPKKNILADLPVAVKNYPAYAASNFDPNSAAAQNIVAAGYPPDIVHRDASGAVTASVWQRYYNEFWEVTMCQWQQRFDPAYVTYTSGPGNYDYKARLTPAITQAVEAVTTTGKIKKPLITIAGTMDALLPITNQARAYEAAVNASRKGNNDPDAQYRLYEVQNGNHIESYTLANMFPELVVIQPHAQKAFDLLVDHVEKNAALPPSQCIPKGGAISDSPTQAGNCKDLFVK